MPHIFWMWKSHDFDLNFKVMVEHLSASSYQTFVKIDNHSYDGGVILNASEANRLYRKLSNVVHGKIGDFESTSPDRFSFSELDWVDHLTIACAIENLLLQLWKSRFQAVSDCWSTKFIHFES